MERRRKKSKIEMFSFVFSPFFSFQPLLLLGFKVKMVLRMFSFCSEETLPPLIVLYLGGHLQNLE